MTKEEIKNYLIENGANILLTRMPAIMERIYACFEVDSEYNLITGSFYEMNSNLSKSIKIDFDGNITVNDGLNTRVFKTMPNGGAKYINKDETGNSIDEPGEYIIDNMGMDKSYSNGSDHNVKREEDGTVDIDGLSITDNGSPILNLYDLLNSKSEKTWKKNRSYLTKEYSNTREWFEQKEQKFEKSKETDIESKLDQDTSENHEISDLISKYERLKRENEDFRRNTVPKKEFNKLKTEKRRAEIEKNILKSQRDEQRASNGQLEKQKKEQQIVITNLQDENQKNKQEIQKLKSSNQNLQMMLKTTLDFCESVRNSFLGRVFFGNKLKQLPRGTQTQEQSSNNQQEEQVR